MLATLASILLIACLMLLLMVIAGGRAVFRHPGPLGLFFAVYLVDNLAISLTNHIPQLQIAANHLWSGFLLWGWSGKLYSIGLISLLLCLSSRLIDARAAGLTLRQQLGSILPSLVIIFLIAASTSLWGSMLPKGAFDGGLLLYMAILPGLNEELVYRGVLPACLEEAFPGRWTLASARFGWSVIIPTLGFALLHGLWFDSAFTLRLDLTLIRNALIAGLLFAWLRERTGSLLMPVAAHGAWDFFFFLPRML